MGELDRAAIVMDDTVEQSVQNEWIHTFEYMMKGALIHLATNVSLFSLSTIRGKNSRLAQ